MQIKGVGIKPIQNFVKEKFGEDGYKRFINSLPEESKKIFNTGILISNWYSFEKGFLEPEKKIRELFYNNNEECVEELIDDITEFSLNGVYKLLLKIGSPGFLLKKIPTVFNYYFQTCKLVVELKGDDKAIVKVLDFKDITPVIEKYIIAWIKKAVLLSGGKNIKVNKIKSLLNSDSTEVEIKWSR